MHSLLRYIYISEIIDTNICYLFFHQNPGFKWFIKIQIIIEFGIAKSRNVCLKTKNFLNTNKFNFEN